MEFLEDGPANAEWTYLFAHGAGGPMRSAFMATVARGLGERGIHVVRFEFPYMAAKRKRPDPQSVLLDSWREVVRRSGGARRLIIGGKSMGGRMATMVADELHVAGLLCYGYPFHPPGQPDKLRTEHLQSLTTPALIVQGERDSFGNREEVAAYRLSSAIRIEWIAGGDHSLKPRNRQSERDNLREAIGAGAAFITSLSSQMPSHHR